jgi:hypothetical protein
MPDLSLRSRRKASCRDTLRSGNAYRIALRRATLLSIACVGALAMAEGSLARSAPDRGLRFDSPGVLDLAQRSAKLEAGKRAILDVLPPADASSILAAAPINEETPLQLGFSEDVFACKGGAAACMREHEAKLIAQADGAVKRIDKRLVVVGVGQPAIFVDWSQAETKSADGDQETHWYLGRLAGNGYHRVEVQFGHDAPGNFLLNPKNGKIAFVHNAADIVAVTADGKYLFTFNTLNPPLSLRVAQLDAAGPKLILVCGARADDDKSSAEFKGWRNASAFDLVVHVGGAAAGHDVALRVSNADNAWKAAASDAAQLTAAGFTCAVQ